MHVVEAETCKMEMLKSKITSKVPPIQPGEVSNTTSSSLEVSKEMAKELARDVVYYFSKTSTNGPCNNHAKTLRRTVDELSRRHEILFTSMVRRLSITEDSKETCQSFMRVMDEMFIDGHYNWGRVITIYAFAGWLARYCVQNGMVNSVEEIVTCSGTYVADKLAQWIQQQGGWDALDRYFPEEENPESTMWKGLLYTFLGLGALATLTALK